MKHHNIAALVVWFLGIIGIIMAAGVVWLTWVGSTIDGGLYSMAGTVIGALGAILTQTRQQQNQREGDKPEPMEVTTPPGEPLETIIADEPEPTDPNPSPLSKVVQTK